jgi:hypothetical protein
MKHPFKIGETYRNELGEYEVISIDESTMLIRYSDGTEQDAEIAFQQRIWERIQDEETMKRQADERRTKSKSRRRSSARLGASFHGLVDTDFKDSIQGTNWRARTGLGGLLARRLSTLTGKEFESRVVARQPRVFVVMPNAFNPDKSLHEAKFEFFLTDNGAYYSFYVEKNNGEMDESWDWLRVLDALTNDVAIQDATKKAMEEYGLQWSIYLTTPEGDRIRAATVAATPDGLTLHIEADDQDHELDWIGIVAYLENLNVNDWCDLYLMQSMPKEEAIDLGVSIADKVAKVWNALMPLYLAAVDREG